MDSTVKARPNHYEALGLHPGASDEEIARAFARAAHLFRPMAEATRIGMAFETLRNPVKRRDYDAALGLTRKPAPCLAPTSVAFKISTRVADRLPRPAADPIGHVDALATERKVTLNPPPVREPEDHRAGSFIAAALRSPVDPAPPRAAPAAPSPAERQQGPQANVGRGVRPTMIDFPVADAMPLGGIDDAEDRPLALNRTTAMAGGLVLAVAGIAAWAGTQAGTPQDALPVKPVASIALPPAKDFAETIAPSPAPMPSAVGVRHPRLRPDLVAAPAVERSVLPPPPAQADQPQGIAGQSVGIGHSDSVVAESTAELPVAEAPRAATIAANLPLPSATIARTIQRIGYACGSVRSTTAVAGGAAGVFNVTCTSGQSYQAKPVRGRYRFRRLSGQ